MFLRKSIGYIGIKCIVIASVFVCVSLVGYGQENNAVSKADSVLLNKILVQLIESIESDNIKTVKGLSSEKIYCPMCVWEIDKKQSMHDSYLVSIDNFVKTWYHDFAQSPILQQYHKRGYRLTILPAKQYAPQGNNKPDIYEAWVQTYLPDEIMPGHEGWQHAFQFVKVDGIFRFSGFDSVP